MTGICPKWDKSTDTPAVYHLFYAHIIVNTNDPSHEIITESQDSASKCSPTPRNSDCGTS